MIFIVIVIVIVKSPALRLFTQPFIRAQIKKNVEVPRHLPLGGESPETGEFPTQMASNAENVSIWWIYHGNIAHMDQPLTNDITTT